MTDRVILDPRVREALDRHGILFDVIACEPGLADTAEFCAHYGVAPQDACNSILIAMKTTPRQYVACLVRSDSRLDVNHRLASATGVKRLSFASAEETAAVTGMAIGGVTVIGMPDLLPIYVDSAVMDRPSIILGGGNRSSKIRLAPSELRKLAGVIVREIAEPRPGAS